MPMIIRVIGGAGPERGTIWVRMNTSATTIPSATKTSAARSRLRTRSAGTGRSDEPDAAQIVRVRTRRGRERGSARFYYPCRSRPTRDDHPRDRPPDRPPPPAEAPVLPGVVPRRGVARHAPLVRRAVLPVRAELPEVRRGRLRPGRRPGRPPRAPRQPRRRGGPRPDPPGAVAPVRRGARGLPGRRRAGPRRAGDPPAPRHVRAPGGPRYRPGRPSAPSTRTSRSFRRSPRKRRAGSRSSTA